MSRDIKINKFQKSQGQLKRIVVKYQKYLEQQKDIQEKEKPNSLVDEDASLLESSVCLTKNRK